MISLKDMETELPALDLAQYRETTQHPKLLAIVAAGIQEQEQAKRDLILDRLLFRSDTGIPTIEGAQIDVWGAIPGVSREGRSDDQYSAILRVTLQVLRSQCTADEIMRIATDIFNIESPLVVGYWTLPPATYSLQIPADVYGDDPDLAVEAAILISRATSAGVGIDEIVSLGDEPFLFRQEGGATTANFSEDGGTTNGLLCVDLANLAGI